MCVVSETEGHVQVFNPAAPGTPPQISVGDNRDLGAITCPSATQCMVVGDEGVAATFDPGSPPAAPVQVTIDGSNFLSGITCPSTAACVAVDAAGRALELAPTALASVVVKPLAGVSGLDAVACASTDQCTAVDDAGRALTGTTPVPGGGGGASGGGAGGGGRGGGGVGGAARLTVTRVRVHGTTAAFTVHCAGASGRCVGRGYMTARETRRGKRTVGVTAHGVKPHRVTPTGRRRTG